MSTDGHRYRFTVPLWEHIGEASWHFVTLPEETSDEIKAITDGGPRRGFGSVRVEVTAATAGLALVTTSVPAAVGVGERVAVSVPLAPAVSASGSGAPRGPRRNLISINNRVRRA